MAFLRSTFSLDLETTAAIGRLAAAWDISKSAVVRRSVRELDARRDLLTEKERRQQLAALDEWLTEDPTRLRSDALAEAKELRSSRREAGQLRP